MRLQSPAYASKKIHASFIRVRRWLSLRRPDSSPRRAMSPECNQRLKILQLSEAKHPLDGLQFSESHLIIQTSVTNRPIRAFTKSKGSSAPFGRVVAKGRPRRVLQPACFPIRKGKIPGDFSDCNRMQNKGLYTGV